MPHTANRFHATLDRPIFIVGPGRSGTTLLRSLLSAHSRVSVTPETQFMARAERWGLRGAGLQCLDDFWDEYTGWERFLDLGVDPERCRELIAAQGKPTFETIFRSLLIAYAEKVGKPRVGEKSPGHVQFLSELLRWFPDAQVIVTLRDPRAVVASQLKTEYVRRRLRAPSLRHGLVTGSRLREVAHYAEDWSEIYRRHLTSHPYDPRFHTTRYEELVVAPEREVRALCNFLGEEFEPAMLHDRNAETVPLPASHLDNEQKAAWRREHHLKSFAPVSTDSLEKWRGDLTRTELSMIEGLCEEAMKEQGYEPTLSATGRRVGRAVAATVREVVAAEEAVRGGAARVKGILGSRDRVGNLTAAVGRRLPPGWLGYRYVEHETLPVHFHRGEEAAGSCVTVHSAEVFENPLPCNVGSREDLPADRGWWGYSFHDVPARRSDATMIATIPDALVTWHWHDNGDFHPAVLNHDKRALDLRQVRFRPEHAQVLRRSGPPQHLEKATWLLERVYHNHSHWLTAHLPKFLLLQERGELADIILPPPALRPPVLDESLRAVGIDPGAFTTFDPQRPLKVDRLTILSTDRFRPQLLRQIPAALDIDDGPPPFRKVYVSRAQAGRRRLLNENDVWPLLGAAGYERVLMEELTFDEQVRLMRETKSLFAPHGAGLTNMVFCRPGTEVMEIADLGFPNPNFYALAAALGHRYWLLAGEGVGDAHPLEKDLTVAPESVEQVLLESADVSVCPAGIDVGPAASSIARATATTGANEP